MACITMLLKGLTIEPGCPALTRPLAVQVLAKRRLRRNYRDLDVSELYLQAAVPRADEIHGPSAIRLQFDQCGKSDRLVGRKILRFQGLVKFDRVWDFLFMLSLAVGQVDFLTYTGV